MPPPVPQRRNYYRRIASLRLPRRLVAVLFIWWSFGVYEYHWGEDFVPEDIEDRALTFLDRSLRLNDVLSDKPPPLRWWFGVLDSEEILADARDGLRELDEEGHLGGGGKLALAMLAAEAEGSPERAPNGKETTAPETLEALAASVATDGGTWWQHAMLDRTPPDAVSRDDVRRAALAYDRKNRSLLVRAVFSAAVDAAVLLAGLTCIPAAWRFCRRHWRAERARTTARYPERWQPSLVIGLFLVADLSCGGFITGAYFMTAAMPTGFMFDVTVDFLWRFVPVVVMLAVLFRHPRHAARALGLSRPVVWPVVFAAFTVMGGVNIALYEVFGHLSEFDPTGGLDPMENGGPGLFYGILSAVIAAPVAEEIFYRGLLLRGLQARLGFPAAAAISSTVFALAHSYDALGLASVGLFGFAAAFIYRSTGSLGTCIALHALYNLSITIPTWMLYHAAL